ncbi:MAG: hypothetical protein IPM02_18235 [Betaproteobacteria bacterium]|nr:hypothetical protein [Betaproteobacteria bacterium]
MATFPKLASGRARVLLHPGGGDPNRTWPQKRWVELAQVLIAEGDQVVRIGAGSPGDGRWVLDLPVPDILDAAQRLSLLATVALMRQADLLVSTDSGPVQLAAASDFSIVGLYSVVPGRNRLPFRHGQPMWHARR